MIRDDLSWSELIRVDPTQTGGPSWSSPTFVPASFILMASDQKGKCDKIHSSDWLTGNIYVLISLKTKTT